MNLMYVAVICALIGLVFAFVLTKRVNSVDAGTDRMKEIASAIAEGARAFLFAEYRILAIFIVVLFVVLCFLRNPLTAVLLPLRCCSFYHRWLLWYDSSY